MTPTQAKEAFTANDGAPILVRLMSGAEYWISEDVAEIGADTDYVYGTRANGRIHLRGRRRVDTRHQTRWFKLSSATLVTD